MSTLEITEGPCEAWITADDVITACAGVGTDAAVAEEAAVVASMLLYKLSGSQYTGVCTHEVRPCGSDGGCGWSWAEVLSPSEASNWAVSWMVGVAGWGWYSDYTPLCGCQHVPRVELGNYPVIGINEVVINGVAVDPTTYELRELRFLDRITPTAEDTPLVWPSCQNMRLPLGEIGTWSVSYTSGVAPPLPGVLAAKQLACEVVKFLTEGECALPDGVTSLTRQGVQMNRQLFMSWGFKNGEWQTGLSWVDGFLQAYNPTGATQRSTVWSPDLEPYPRPVNA